MKGRIVVGPVIPGIRPVKLNPMLKGIPAHLLSKRRSGICGIFGDHSDCGLGNIARL